MSVSLNAACRLLTPDDVGPAAQVLAQAFIDDPLCTFILPFRKTRLQTLFTVFRALGEVSITHQRAYGVGDPLQGVAYWKFPQQNDVSISLKSLGKFIPLLFTFYPIGLFRARAILKQIEALHQTYAAEPHFYLDNLGIVASARGQGLASRLIRPFLQMADEQNVIAYTDTVTRANVSLYEHFGFQCMEAREVPGTGLTAWALRRPAPRNPGPKIF